MKGGNGRKGRGEGGGSQKHIPGKVGSCVVFFSVLKGVGLCFESFFFL